MEAKRERKRTGTSTKRISRKRRYPWKNPTELQKVIYDCFSITPLGQRFHIPPERPFYRGKKADERRKIAYEIKDALNTVRERDTVIKARGLVKYNPLLKDVFDENIQV